MNSFTFKKIEKNIKTGIEHLDFLQKFYKFDLSLTNFFEERNRARPKHRFDDVKHLHLLFIITELEINLVLKGLYYSNSETEKKYLIKKGYHIVYEFFQYLFKRQNGLNKIFEEHESLKEEYQLILKKLKFYRKNIKYETKIKKIRDNTAGHFMENLFEFLDIVDSIDAENDYVHFYELGFLIHGFNNFLLKYTKD